MLFLAQGAPDISNDQRANGPNDTRKYTTHETKHNGQCATKSQRQRVKVTQIYGTSFVFGTVEKWENFGFFRVNH